MTGGKRGHRGTSTLALAAFCLAACGLFPVPASAELFSPDSLWRVPVDRAPGSGAGRFNNPRGVAADPRTGHIFLSEINNARISELTPWGEFIKAWGWDVAPGSVNEEQELRVSAAAGQFRLEFGGEVSADIEFDTTSEEVESALNALGSISAGGGSVSVSGGPGDPTGSLSYLVSFDGGPLAGADVAQLGVEEGTTPLSGGEPTSAAAVQTRANGAPAGAGFESCTAASGCKPGVGGGNASGQFDKPTGVAVDGAGDVYVYDRENRRAQKFSPTGEFLLMFGGAVNKTKVEEGAPAAEQNVCPVDPGDVCQKGAAGEADGYLANTVGTYLTYGPVSETIFVGGRDRIQEFGTDGSFIQSIALPEAREVESLAADPTSGDLYFVFAFSPPDEEPIYRLDPGTGEVLDELEAFYPQALAADADGNVYASLARYSDNNAPTLDTEHEVLGFDSEGTPIPGMELADGFANPAFELPDLPPSLPALAANTCAGSDPPGNLYVTHHRSGDYGYLTAYGSAPIGCEPPPPAPPAIEAQYATSVTAEGAVVGADINPRFWDDTTYFVQYGTAECPESGWTAGCEAQPATPAALTEAVTNLPVPTVGVSLGGLGPGTTYHYRFVAQSSGGGPVFGLGGEPGEEGTAASFRTFALPSETTPPCDANERFRTGPGAFLPDCRAYELVSPLDKNNGDVVVKSSSAGPISATQSSLFGERLTYSSIYSFGEPEGAPFSSQYLAERHPLGDAQEGWANESISPPRTTLAAVDAPLNTPEYKAFSSDLCAGWLLHDSDPPLTEDAVPGFLNLYRRANCGPFDYETLTPEAPPPGHPGDYWPELQGVSADGATAIYAANDRLADAPVNGDFRYQLYAQVGGQLRFVCYLPNGDKSGRACSAGMHGNDRGFGHRSNLQGALSSDDSLVYWTAYSGGVGGVFPGSLYVSENPGQPQSAHSGDECTEPGKACTLAVSGAVSADPARFWGAAADGSAAIFSIGPIGAEELYRFELAAAKAGEEASTPIAGELGSVLGMSEDASRVYFTSREDLDEGGPAAEGVPNLYLYEAGGGGSLTFIGDAGAAGGSPWPSARRTRVSADGRHLAFVSTASPTGYDNLDAKSGQPDSEVYLYRADEEELLCVSCNPTGARPSGRLVGGTSWVAGQIPAWERSLYASRVLSEDGSRLFFESYDALALRDGNGAKDVYQWKAEGSGGCDGADSSFVAAAGGCVDLISSGQSPSESSFLDAGADGSDVFFTTLSSLLSQDESGVDVYDARVNGGFPAPPSPRPPCEGDACQGPASPPAETIPSSSVYEGPGNLSAQRPRRCGRPARKARALSKRARRYRRAAERASNPRRARAMRRRAARERKRAKGLSRNARRCRARAKRRAAR